MRSLYLGLLALAIGCGDKEPTIEQDGQNDCQAVPVQLSQLLTTRLNLADYVINNGRADNRGRLATRPIYSTPDYRAQCIDYSIPACFDNPHSPDNLDLVSYSCVILNARTSDGADVWLQTDGIITHKLGGGTLDTTGFYFTEDGECFGRDDQPYCYESCVELYEKTSEKMGKLADLSLQGLGVDPQNIDLDELCSDRRELQKSGWLSDLSLGRGY